MIMNIRTFTQLHHYTLILASLLLLSATPAQAQLFGKLFHRTPADSIAGRDRVDEVFGLIYDNYVETPNTDKLADEAVRQALKTLDPHCLYIPAKDVERANEALQGNFIGIGMTFNIIRDSVVIIDLTPGGVAERVGMKRGDRVVEADGHSLVGDSVTTATVAKYVRGPQGSKGTFVNVRKGEKISFTLTRERINIPSVTPYFMADDSTGYICVIRFARNTVSEFLRAVSELQKQGMKNMILDLRGNSGGFLDMAIGLANEFLDRGDLIVYTQGRIQKRTDARANGRGHFRKGKVVIMLDEHSASASEVLSGALQDHDRAVIVGRRSFGKGLVQRLFTLKDGGQIRLTTARYYTPSGRCIQKPYGDSINYNDDIHQRFLNGELTSVDSIKHQIPDSLRFLTRHGRTVYGGGGIVPDIFVPLDTTRLAPFVLTCRRKLVTRDFAQDFVDAHREELPRQPLSPLAKGESPLHSQFSPLAKGESPQGEGVLNSQFSIFNLDSLFTLYAAAAGYTRDSLATDDHSEVYLHTLLLSEVAQRLWGTAYYYQVMKDFDDHFHQALEAVRRN